MEYHREINLEFVTVCSDKQQSSKAHGLTCQLLQWGWPCVCACLRVCACVCKHACVCMCVCVCVTLCVYMCLCASVCACVWVHVRHACIHTHTHSHTQGNVTPPWQVGPCALDCPYHTTFQHFGDLSTEVHQTLLTCRGDVIHP